MCKGNKTETCLIHLQNKKEHRTWRKAIGNYVRGVSRSQFTHGLAGHNKDLEFSPTVIKITEDI